MEVMQTLATPYPGSSPAGDGASNDNRRTDWITSIPYFFVHAACILLVFMPPTWSDIALCIGLYYLRMFGITAGYHRYFSHRAYKTGRVFQFILAFIGTTSLQKGVLWWAAHHRAHHKYSDEERDIHSPRQRGLYWAHQGWILCPRHNATDWARIQDFAKYPELRWLNNHFISPALLAVGTLFLIAFGVALFGHTAREALWKGAHAAMWGGFLSTVLLWHGTFTINSLAHVWGSRRYKTTDDSRNNLFLALLTMGEGWHNNHHHYQSTANQGFFWWEIDFSYYILKVLSWFGIVWDLRTPPAHIVHDRAPSEAEKDAAPAPEPAVAAVADPAA
jgi:stearoyl-CoA desaturase (delta-9 desaturase)